MLRSPHVSAGGGRRGGKRSAGSPSLAARVLSVIAAENHRVWFQQIWSGVTGASTKDHPAPFPVELAERLIQMFSFVGDTVLDPFGGTGTTTLAASRVARNSISVEVDPEYFRYLCHRVRNADALLSSAQFIEHDDSPRIPAPCEYPSRRPEVFH